VTTVALYVSGHGYGHSVRAAEVAAALLARGARVLVRTDAPAWLYPAGVEHSAQRVDIGVIQRGGLEMDIDATRAAWTAFADEFDARASVEAGWLGEQRVDVVLGDVPPLAFEAAAQYGVPSVAMTNFGWDWIYEPWPAFEPIVARIRAAYAHAERLLRLPLHSTEPGTFAAFRRIEDVPLIARRARRSRGEARTAYGLPMDRRLVLLSFGGFNAPGLDFDGFGQWIDYTFVATPPISIETSRLPRNLLVLERQPDDYVSLLAACDAVITKPGYGIVADCLANRVSVLYTDRGPFREYPVLVDALERQANARYIPNAEVMAGRVGPFLDALLDAPRPWTAGCMMGADVVAERVLSVVGTRNAQERGRNTCN
jgi:UDP:flavonoid glycosyltransferase YjiC (YdhE family)